MARRFLWIGIAIVALAAALAYLRDPPWLASVESGFRSWEAGADGIKYRWTGGHASFFVPADAPAILIPVRTSFDAPGDPAVRLSIAIDDRPADEVVLRDDGWVTRKIRLPSMGSRRLRRIDLRVDRVRDGNKGAQVGEVTAAR